MAGSASVMQGEAETGQIAQNSAQFYKHVTDIVPGVIYVFNHITQSNEYFNRSMGASLGYSAVEIQQMGDQMIAQLIHPDDVTKVLSNFENLRELADGEALQLEYRVRAKDGSWIWLLSNDSVFERDTYGKVVRHIGVAIDITQQKQAEETARKALVETTNTNEELRSFSHAMSHDMKAPSNTLSMLMDELAFTHGETLDEDARELIAMSRRTVGRLGALVDDVLCYTSVIGQEAAHVPVNLNDLLADVVQELDPLLQAQRGNLTLNALPWVMGDREQLRSLFQQLVDNALRFHAADKPPKVEIGAKACSDGTAVDIYVRDEGLGIVAEKQKDVFKVFKRLNAAPEFSGTGLGLAICRRIAVNHGTSISLTSRPGAGTTVSIRLERASK